MYPKLVENKIKQLISVNLNQCHNLKMKYYNFLYNCFCVIFLVLVIGTILYNQYQSKKNPENMKIKENKKRDYILYNIRKFQNMNNKVLSDK